MHITDKASFTSTLTGAFQKNGLSSLLKKDTVDTFLCLTERMLTVNEQFNLTAITSVEGIIFHHYLDCAVPAMHLPRGARIIDVGCGAGFPSLPIAILRPDITVLAIDSTGKKVSYVADTAKELGLTNLSTAVMRAEDGARDASLRESFDVATARAVADLRILAELCLPFVRVGGQMLAMKGAKAAYELQDAKRALAMLGGRDARLLDVRLVGADEPIHHPLIFISKGTKTPAIYPRPYAQISKKPL